MLQGLVLGFVLNAIPGVVFLETTRRALAKRAVLSFLAGNYIGVIIVIMVTMFGLASVLKNSTWSHAFYLLSGVTLLYIGLTSIASKKLKPKTVKIRAKTRISPHHKAFAAGFVLAIANPVGILFWVAIIGRYLNGHENYFQIASNSTAILLGGAFFYALLLFVISLTHKLISPKYMVVLSDVFGVIILVYGGFIMTKAL